jgi:DNA-binding SARP family transcriptional activator
MDDGSTTPVVLRLLRGFALSVDDRRLPLSWSAQRLTAFLALRDRPLARGYVAGTLWPDTTAFKASANLRSSLWRTQGVCRQLIDSTAQQLALAGHVVVDIRAAEAGAQRLLDAAVPCDDVLTAPIRSALGSDLLPDWYDDDWLIVEREKFHQLRLHALEAMCARLTAAGRYGEAVDAGLLAIRAEPLRESAHLALIKAYLAAGNRWDAVRQFERFRLLLDDELGLAPSPDLCLLMPALPVPARRAG